MAPALSARTVSTGDYTPRLRESRQVIYVPKKGQQVTSDSRVQSHLNQLMLEHAEHASLNSSRGMMPFARVAQVDNEQ